MVQKFIMDHINKLRFQRYKNKQKAIFEKLELEHQTEISACLNFYKEFNGFRTIENCSIETRINENFCKIIKNYLYETRKIGFYYFEESIPPQKYMQQYILSHFPMINHKSFILEVGPGEFPMFEFNKYENWYGIDKNYSENTINFKNLSWAKNKYPSNKIFNGEFESISNSIPNELIGKFDILCASHTYEHVFKPIKSLKESLRILKPEGIITLFVPDPYSLDYSLKDYTHTLYLTKEMIEEFFFYAQGFNELKVKQFRPNADLVITAVKKAI